MRKSTKKTVVEDCYTLSVRELSERIEDLSQGLPSAVLVRTQHGEREPLAVDLRLQESVLHLDYTINGERVGYSIQLHATQPHFGGLRAWFECPLAIDGKPCRRRVSKLYLPPGAKFFGCRCRGLSYTSTQRAWASRLRTLYESLEILQEDLDSKEEFKKMAAICGVKYLVRGFLSEARHVGTHID